MFIMYNTIRVSSVLETENGSMRGGRRSRRPEAFLQGHPTFTSLSIDWRKHFLTLRQPISEPRGRILERPLCAAVSLSLLARTHSVALPRHCLSSTTVRVPLPALIKSLSVSPLLPTCLELGLESTPEDWRNAMTRIMPRCLSALYF